MILHTYMYSFRNKFVDYHNTARSRSICPLSNFPYSVSVNREKGVPDEFFDYFHCRIIDIKP